VRHRPEAQHGLGVGYAEQTSDLYRVELGRGSQDVQLRQDALAPEEMRVVPEGDSELG
jgi:hypothetical protein